MLSRTSKPAVPFEHLKSYIGRHLVDLFGDLFPEASADQIQTWILEYREIYLGRGHKLTTLYPGVQAALSRLGGVKGTATTKSSATAKNILSQFGLLEHFDHIQGTDGFPSKPNPEVIERALHGLGVAAADCLFIGDSVPDMVAGKAAGVRTCAVAYGYGKADDLQACAPDFWLENLSEL